MSSCSRGLALGTGYLPSTVPCLFLVSSKHMSQPGIAVGAGAGLHVLFSSVHSVSVSPPDRFVCEEGWLTRVLPKEFCSGAVSIECFCLRCIQTLHDFYILVMGLAGARGQLNKNVLGQHGAHRPSIFNLPSDITTY